MTEEFDWLESLKPESISPETPLDNATISEIERLIDETFGPREDEIKTEEVGFANNTDDSAGLAR